MTFSSDIHSASVTFGLLLHYKTGHTLLLSQDKGNIPWFVCSYHLQSQAVHSALAAHLVQIVVLKEVVSKPPLCICDTRVRQLHLKDGILPRGHSGVAQRPEDAHTLCGQTGRRSKVTLPDVKITQTVRPPAINQTTLYGEHTAIELHKNQLPLSSVFSSGTMWWIHPKFGHGRVEEMFITFHGHGSRSFLVPSVTGILSAICHVQLAYG